MSTRKRSTAPASDTFFGEYLGSDNPLTRRTAEGLLKSASLIQSIAPWELIQETDLMFHGGTSVEPLSMCSVMGSLGESFAFFTYVGGSSFFEFQDLQEGRIHPREFFARQHSVRVEFVRASELTKPDRALLAALDFKAAPGTLRPMFRTIRPHYHPWYPSEEEGLLLLFNLIAFLSLFRGEKLPDYWREKGVYPLVEVVEGKRKEHRVSLLRPPEPTLDIKPANFDPDRLRRILSRNHRRGGALEVDCFHVPGRIGKPKERPLWLRMAVALDAKTGTAYPPEAVDADVLDGDATAAALCAALESGAPIPDDIVVSSPVLEIALEPLAVKLGAKLVRQKNTPAVDEFRDVLTEKMLGGFLP